MPGAAFGVFFLQFLVSVIQGLQNYVIPGATVEAVVGQNISLPCILEDDHDLKITIIEWTKNGATKLAVYSVVHGLHLHWPNVTVQIKRSSTSKTLGTYLYLQNVEKWDSGNYACTITSFPFGSDISVTRLIVKDVTVAPENLTERIHSSLTPPSTTELLAHANWTVHPNSSDASVTDSLATNISETTEEKATLSNSFTSAATPNNHFTTNQPFNFTTTNADTTLIQSTLDSSLTPPSTTELSPHVNWTVHPNSSDASVTDSLTTNISETTEEKATTTTNAGTTLIQSTLNSTGNQMTEEPNPHKLHLTTIYSSVTEESSTLKSSTKNSEDVNLSPTQKVTPPDGKDTTRSHLVLIVIPVLTLVGVIGFLYWIQKSYKRKMKMEGPPLFKPPPPPVKYTATRQDETSTQFFPTARCNSIADYTDNTYV
ncbi:T-cell surface protein tactile [Oryzias latipes]|uniref:T-cell surface protein tactile n=1 Tax=Oryzias latipes TaxID=8090 RepID=UPI0005CC192B|nr:T-cell surface protein tactile [Oryzias latipes]